MVDDPGEQRWPKRLYREGSEPDPRFTMANERTFLAWIRTAMALMAGGVGIEALNAVAEQPSALRTALAALLLVTGVVCSAGAFTRWVVTERALRRDTALPAPRMAPVLGYGLAALGIIACVLLLTTGV
ncbi:DUF202 domain-containing protein [Saccharopolyspora sp. HNM0983]|uniref:DUF202 domain-containing protein n=1 Tax=Saccharopolyspora montiporae TaxID=2781240 RepID=A0A929G0Y9_9PSEU|nr:DUF202 domain-containing protein [Saccharopolyspora sp. HNM0983]MBE9375804.1 DUF202 domain-containing protein [Saccharopolyspora sp. HNM0983]